VDNQVCAVVVTYNATDELIDNIAAIRSQVSHLVIVDNGSRLEGVDLVETSRARFNCEVILNSSNFGIAKAMNIGIGYAAAQGCKQAVFFDQDSIAGNRRYVPSLLDAYQESSRLRPIAMIAPRYFDRSSGEELPSAKGRDGCLLAAMTSGTLVPISIFESLGMYDEQLYMDYVDIEFCLRCRRAGHSIVEAPRAILLHSLGRRTKHTICGRVFSTTNHNASRRYYITRNRLLLMRRYWRDWRWCIREIKAFVSEFIKIILAEEHKKDKLASVACGVADALRNRSGERLGL
jgi:rhamnosyltransferase